MRIIAASSTAVLSGSEFRIAVLTVLAAGLSGKLVFANRAAPVNNGENAQCQSAAEEVTDAEYPESRGEVQTQRVGNQKAGEHGNDERNPNHAKNPVPVPNQFDLFRCPVLNVCAGWHCVDINLANLAVVSHGVDSTKGSFDDAKGVVPDFFVPLRNPAFWRTARSYEFLSRMAPHHRIQAQSPLFEARIFHRLTITIGPCEPAANGFRTLIELSGFSFILPGVGQGLRYRGKYADRKPGECRVTVRPAVLEDAG